MIDDPNRPDQPDPASSQPAWVTGPPPAGYTGTWPPPLPPGGQYGSTPGSIVYPGGSPPSNVGTPGGTSPDYHPGDYAQPPTDAQKIPIPTPTPAPSPTGGGGGAPPPTVVQSPNPGIPSTPTPAPTPNLPEAPKVPAFTPPPAFFYDPFHAPTGDDVLNDPGYKVSFDEGQRAIGASAASRGTLNTGGTLKDYVTFGNNLASKTYGDIFARDLQAYQVNRGNAIDAYNTNYGTQYKDPYTINYQTQYKDPFTANYTRAQDTYNAQQHNYDQDLYYKNHQGDQAEYYKLQYQLLNHQISQDEFNNKLHLLGFIQ